MAGVAGAREVDFTRNAAMNMAPRLLLSSRKLETLNMTPRLLLSSRKLGLLKKVGNAINNATSNHTFPHIAVSVHKVLDEVFPVAILTWLEVNLLFI